MKKNEFLYRKSQEGDDFAAIAKYIHLTDPYIYPTICEDPCDPFWSRLILDCASEKTNLFSRENIFLALWDEKIIGVLCAVRCGEQLTFWENLQLSERERSRLGLSYEGYFRPLLEESANLEGYNITNVCVDSAFRGQGVGEGLLRFYLSWIGHETVHLDVIANNVSAIRLYERCGFKIEQEYGGFSGTNEPLPCYHMIRKRVEYEE